MITYKGAQYADWAAVRQDVRRPDAVLVDPEPAEAESPDPEPILQVSAVMAPKRKSLTEKYRPRTLADIVGQLDAVAVLQEFVNEPYSWPFIFAGDTGTGKTSAAWALAADLGCNIDASPVEFGGVFSIASGEHNADAIRNIWPLLHAVPFDSELGWKVLILNEIEQLSGTVERLWLDKLEDLPPRTVIAFTTNAVESLPARFRDRCTVIPFESSKDSLAVPARKLAELIWQAETGQPGKPEFIEKIVSRSIQNGQISFRRVLQNIVPALAKGKISWQER